MKKYTVLLGLIVCLVNTVAMADDTSYVSLHRVSTTINSVLDESGTVNTSTFTVNNFRDRYHANDPRTMCNMRLGPATCPFSASTEAALSFYTIQNYQPTQFRFYLPPGTTKLQMNLRYTQSAEAKAAIRIDNPPVTTDKNAAVNSDPSANLSNLLAGQEIIAAQADGTLQVSGIQVPLASPLTTGRWVYIHIIDTKQQDHLIFKIDAIINAQASNYTAWFNTCQFDSLGNVIFAGAAQGDVSACSAPDAEPPVEVDVDIPATLSMFVGESKVVSVSAGVVIQFTSSDPGVATVHPTTGVVTGVSQGTTTITAQGASEDNTDTMTVTVEAAPPIDMPSAATAGVNQSITLIPLLGEAVSYVSSDTSVATVSIDGNGNANVTGKKEGTATITATDADGNTDTTLVTVIPEPTLSLPGSKTVQVGKTSVVSPLAGTVVSCTVTDETIASVNVNNNQINITGKLAGATDIVCKDASEAQATISVTVVEVDVCTVDCEPPPDTCIFFCVDPPAPSTNSAPVAKNLSVEVNVNESVDMVLEGTDADGDSLTYKVTESVTHGNFEGTVPNLKYIPDADYTGPDSFKYTVDDGTVESAEATVNITVNGPDKGFDLSPVLGTNMLDGSNIPAEQLTNISFFGGGEVNDVYKKIFTVDDVVNITMNIGIDPEHVGREGTFYVFVFFDDPANSLLMFMKDGLPAFVPWEGVLYSFNGSKTLLEEEVFTILEGVKLDVAFAANVIVAYGLVSETLPEEADSEDESLGTGENIEKLIFHQIPMELNWPGPEEEPSE